MLNNLVNIYVSVAAQAASIVDNIQWFGVGGFEKKMQLFPPLQRWLWHCGSGLLQLECSTSFGCKVTTRHIVHTCGLTESTVRSGTHAAIGSSFAATSMQYPGKTRVHTAHPCTWAEEVVKRLTGVLTGRGGHRPADRIPDRHVCCRTLAAGSAIHVVRSDRNMHSNHAAMPDMPAVSSANAVVKVDCLVTSNGT
jgi:hypothetical protein